MATTSIYRSSVPAGGERPVEAGGATVGAGGGGGRVADIAAAFRGSSIAQPEAAFQAVYTSQMSSAKQAQVHTRAQNAAYRGKGNDWMSEFERMRRLEAEALRRAEAEALANLHRYRGSHALILALERAKLGLPLTATQQRLIDEHAAEMSIVISFSPEQIADERAKALEHSLALEQSRVDEAGAPREGDALRGTTFAHDARAAGDAGIGSVEPMSANPSLPLSPTDLLFMAPAGGLQSDIHELSSVGGGGADSRSLPSLPPRREETADAEHDPPSLIGLITAILQERGAAMTLGDMSYAIFEATGKRWGAFFEPKFGTLLQFIRTYGEPGYHIVSYNKYVSLPGMPLPNLPTSPQPTSLATTTEAWPAGGDAAGDMAARRASMPAILPSQMMAHPMHSYNGSMTSYYGMPTPASGYGAGYSYATPMYGGPTPMMLMSNTNASMYPGMYAATPMQYMMPAPPATAPEPPSRDFSLEEFDPLAQAAKARAEREEQERREAEEAAAQRALAAATAYAGVTESKEDSGYASSRALNVGGAASGGRGTLSTTTFSSEPLSAARGGARDADDVLSHHMDSSRRTYRGKMATETEVQVNIMPQAAQYRGPPAAPASSTMSTYTRRDISGGASASAASAAAPPLYNKPLSPPSSRRYSMPAATTSHRATGSFDVEAHAQRAVARGVCDGDEALTWQDFDILFRPILIHGFVLIKHGRSGEPKRRRFWMTNSLNRLYWDTNKIMELVRHGQRHINMADVNSIVDGIGTDLMRKKVARGELRSGDSSRCFSLLTTTRTFDLEASSVAQKKVLLRAFNFLVSHLSRPRGTPVIQSASSGISSAYYGY